MFLYNISESEEESVHGQKVKKENRQNNIKLHTLFFFKLHIKNLIYTENLWCTRAAVSYTGNCDIYGETVIYTGHTESTREDLIFTEHMWFVRQTGIYTGKAMS